MTEEKYVEVNTASESNNLEVLKKKVNLFATRRTPVHISFKKDGVWRNGYIVTESADFFEIIDVEANSVINSVAEPIFYLEIKDIRPYKEKDEKDGTAK
jgi:hypothetical protein